MKTDQEFDDIENEFLESINPALKARYGPEPDVPMEIDNAILADARRHFEQYGPATLRSSRRRQVRYWQWAAIASTVAAACVMSFALKPQQPSSENDAVSANSDVSSADDVIASDVDLNGRIDILDAFTMARQVRDGDVHSHDFNHDGRFDQLDIKIVAQEAVRL